jgi:hypothetical protein
MLRLRNLLVVLAVYLILPSQALGQGGTIKFINNPAWSGTDVKADGSYTVDDKTFAFKSITFHLVNPNGGKGGQAPCTVNMTKKTWGDSLSARQMQRTKRTPGSRFNKWALRICITTILRSLN